MNTHPTYHTAKQRKFLRCEHCEEQVEVGHDAARCVCGACVSKDRTFSKTKQGELL